MKATPTLIMPTASKLEVVPAAAAAAMSAVTDQPFMVNLKPPILSILSCKILYSSVSRDLKSASSNAGFGVMVLGT